MTMESPRLIRWLKQVRRVLCIVAASSIILAPAHATLQRGQEIVLLLCEASDAATAEKPL